MDEYPYHQITATFAGVGGTDPAWNDGHYLCLSDMAGEVGLASTLRLYQNNDVLDGFICLRHEGRQHNVRVSRRLRPAMDHLGAGPLRLDVVEPMRTGIITPVSESTRTTVESAVLHRTPDGVGMGRPSDVAESVSSVAPSVSTTKIVSGFGESDKSSPGGSVRLVTESLEHAKRAASELRVATSERRETTDILINLGVIGS
jgi:hypothetical protein